MLTLTVDHRLELRAKAHTLHAVVMIGKAGLSANVIEELDRSLASHELIKIKSHINNRIARDVLLEEICQKLGAAQIQHIGKIFVIYRPKPIEDNRSSENTCNKKKCEPFRAKRNFQN